LFPLKGALSQREAPVIIYLLTGSANVMPWNKFRFQQAQAHLLDRRKYKGSNHPNYKGPNYKSNLKKKKKQTNVKITKRQNQNYKTPVKHNHRIGNFPDVAVKEFNLFRKRIPHAEHSDHR
jgi:hypothetical protein